MDTLTGSSSSDLRQFRPLINAINLEALALFARETRLSQLSEREVALDRDNYSSCIVDHNPTAGAYNLIYTIKFRDNTKWVARFPANGVSATFTDVDRQQMHSDYNTMRYIRSKIGLLIPEVFLVETDDNAVGAPYALISFVEGTTVSERWYDKSWITPQRRNIILLTLARQMSKLHELQFDKFGSLTFDERGSFTHIGPMIERQSALDGGLNLKGTFDVNDGSANFDRTVQSGPFEHVREYLVDPWNDARRNLAEWNKAEQAIVRLAIDSIPKSLINYEGFFLSPPDLDAQNVLIDDQGNVTGLIDWDCTHTHCPIGSFARYPSWITNDWDPIRRGYDDDQDKRPKESPDQLSSYRQIYAGIFRNLGVPATYYSAEDTRLSHILGAIEIAARNRVRRGGIVPKLLDHAFKSDVPFQFQDFARERAAGNANILLQQVKEAFRTMWHVEWESKEDSL